jgi:dihydrofolate reductase
MTTQRKVIVHIATSADGYIARPDGDLAWLTSRPGVQFVNDAIGPFVRRLREQSGKDIWLMGGGDLIASFLDEQAIDEFFISVVPVFIGDGIPLIARRHRHVPLTLVSIERFEDGLAQLHYRVQHD